MIDNLSTIVEKIKLSLAEEQLLGGLNVDDVNENTSLIEGGLDIDSIGIIDVISLVESMFSIKFKDEDLRLQTFESIGALANVVSSRMGE